MQALKFTTRNNINYYLTAFFRLHLDNEDILYDQAFNNSFHDRLESVQYNACLAIMGVFRGAYQRKFISRIRYRISLAWALVQKALAFL